MDVEVLRSWPSLPRECLESIARCGGPQAAACLSSTCKSWRKDLADDILWRSWHGLPMLRYHTWRSSYSVYGNSLRAWLGAHEQGGGVVAHAHDRWITSLDLSPTHVLSGSLDANVKYWDRSRPGTWIHYLRGHTGPVSSVRLAYDGGHGGDRGGGASVPSGRAFSGSRDGTLRCWDLVTGACVRAFTLEGGRQWINTVAVWRRQQQERQAPQAAAHAVPLGAGEDGGLQQQAAAGPGSIHSRFGALGGAMYGTSGSASPSSFPYSFSSYSSAAGPMTVVCGTSIGQLSLYDVRQPNPAQRILENGEGPPRGAVYGTALYGDALAAACANGCIYVWDLRTGTVRQKLDEHGSACTCVAMYGHTLVAGDLEGSVYLWSAQPSALCFRGAIVPPAVSTRHTASASARQGATTVSTTTTAAAAAAVRVLQGPSWPQWRPHRRRPGLNNPRDASDGSGSDSDVDSELGRRWAPRCTDGAAVVTVLEALAAGRAAAAAAAAAAPHRSPRTGGLPLGPGQDSHPAPGRQGASVAARPAAGGAADGTWGSPHAGLPPELRAVMRHAEWVRDVALVGPTLLLSCSKDGLVCLSRTDTMQVVAIWDVAPSRSAGSPGRDRGDRIREAPPGGPGGVAAVDRPEMAAAVAAGGPGHVCNQVHALAADEWGFVAGCQDTSMRMWSFAPGGLLPELWAPLCGVNDAGGRLGMTSRLLSDMGGLSC